MFARPGCTSATPALAAWPGARYLYFYEDFDLRNQFTLTLTSPQNLTILIPPVPPATTPQTITTPINLSGQTSFSANSSDSIRCRNDFYGGQVGLVTESIFGQFYLQARVKLAAGAMRQTVDIVSYTYSPTVNLGGTIFNTGDVGTKTRNQVSFIPELNLKMGWQFCHWCRAYVGYDGMFVTNVVRPANQLAPASTVQVNVANTSNQANINQNSFRFSDSNLTINGISFGVELRW